jgi:uncharacterized protein YcbK (DUF882 family)
VNSYKNFTVDEFACRCGCGKNHINPQLIAKLDNARDIACTPFVISSGYRCKTHNKKVGGSDTSSHTLGEAVDIKVNNSSDRQKILTALTLEGFDRIGIAKNFIHVDIDQNKPKNVTWVY